MQMCDLIRKESNKMAVKSHSSYVKQVISILSI